MRRRLNVLHHQLLGLAMRIPYVSRLVSNDYSLQMMVYFVIGGLSSLMNIVIFSLLYHYGVDVIHAAVVAYLLSALFNYLMCLQWAFKEPSRWPRPIEIILYGLVVLLMTVVDARMTQWFVVWMPYAFLAKALACAIGYVLNFFLRKYIVFQPLKTP